MRKVYITPQVEVMQLTSEELMDSIGIVHHSGGGPGGFDDEHIIW